MGMGVEGFTVERLKLAGMPVRAMHPTRKGNHQPHNPQLVSRPVPPEISPVP